MVCGMVENTPGHEEECSVREFNYAINGWNRM